MGKEPSQVLTQPLPALRLLNLRARIIQLHERRVLAHLSGSTLLVTAHAGHLGVGVVCVGTRARALRTVSDDYTHEALLGVAVACQDTRDGHDLQIILMRSDC